MSENGKSEMGYFGISDNVAPGGNGIWIGLLVEAFDHVKYGPGPRYPKIDIARECAGLAVLHIITDEIEVVLTGDGRLIVAKGTIDEAARVFFDAVLRKSVEALKAKMVPGHE